MTTLNLDFKDIRSWRGSQHQAFEELCYQLRDPTPEGAKLVKTGDPDGGLEWYVKFRNGTQWGWQAKFSFDIDSLLKGMEKSLKTIVEKRPKCRRLTFCIPFDLPDAVEAGKRKSARQKFEDKKQSWKRRIRGADRVRIDLWSGGDLLQHLVDHPGQRGITRFFWDKELFSPDWCARRMSIAHEMAGRRYTPELHVDLPVSFVLEGLAMSEVYWRRLRDVRKSVLHAMAQIQISRYAGLGIIRKLNRLKKKMDEWQRITPKKSALPQRLERETLLDLTQNCMDLIPDVDQPRPPRGQRTRTRKQLVMEDLAHRLRNVESGLSGFRELLRSDASKVAAGGALLLEGPAGQGKTHLFCDMGDRAVKAKHPAVVILGGSLSGRSVWSEIASQLGLEDVGSEELVSTMQAAAEASNVPFLLLVDALNEADDPKAWQGELPRLFAEVAQNPWISVAVSVRSTFLDIVLPESGLSNVTKVEHHGFDGRELEATERFFDAAGLEQPRIPLLTPEFTNPLFLKLYCESLSENGLSAPSLGEAHLSQTFGQYLEWKERRVAKHLSMDPTLHPVQKAIGKFSKALVEAKSGSLPYEDASNLIDAFGHGHYQWPDTLFGQLLSEGVLSKDLVRDYETNKCRQVVRFTYQQLADYQVVSILLDPFDNDTESLRRALSPGEPLHQTLLDAPPNWIEALAVLVPERFGIELLDTADWDLDTHHRRMWTSALSKSVCVRRPSAVTERTVKLLDDAQKRDTYSEVPILKILLSVATQPQHLLNAYWLHKLLKRMSMPDRDAAWSRSTYNILDEGGPLDRLIRWASRSLRSDCPPEVVELAATTLTWTFTSPNRILRDHATKALSQLLSAHLSVLPTLVSRFAGVNDPYVIERLAVACHGAALCGYTVEPQTVVRAAEELKRVVFADDQPPNLITRDAVRGIYEWCFHNDWVDEHTYNEVLPPYLSDPPKEPPTEEHIRRNYNIQSHGTGPASWPYVQLLSSVFGLGDFGIYIIQSAMRSFTSHPLDKAIPKVDPRAAFNATWAQRWVFQRVISLGWTPERFADFDWGVNIMFVSNTGHKPERFGKKYQWIAFHELIARVVDNFHMMPEYGGEPVTYEGPWQLLLRDIDPTLPPPLRTLDMDGYAEVGRTFADGSDHWWLPDGPCYRDDDPPASRGDSQLASEREILADLSVESLLRITSSEGWGTDRSDIPKFEPLVRRQDDGGTKWVVLHAWYIWTGGPPWERTGRSRRREMRSHIYSWLVRPKQREAVVGYLEHILMGRMPEGAGNINTAYLGELPWAISRNNSEDIWQPVPHHLDEESTCLEVSPAWEEYNWEGNNKDCSINDGVQACYPAPFLFGTGALTWKPSRREWMDRAGATVAQFVESGDHSALLVREDWLKRTLRTANLDVVFGWSGEKRLLGKNGIVGGWTEINVVASLDRYQ